MRKVKCFNYLDLGNCDLSIFQLNKAENITKLESDYDKLVAEWIIENYENFYFDSTINLNIINLMKEIEEATKIFEDFRNNINTIETQKLNDPLDKNIKIEYLPHLDKFLIISGPYIKLLSRNSTGNFDFELLSNRLNSGKNLVKNLNLIFNLNELKEIIEIINWKNLIFSNLNSFRAIYYFFNSFRKIIKINNDLVILPIKTKQGKKIIQLLLTHLNKILFCTRESEALVEALKKKQSINFDKEIDKSLPFAPEYEEEDKDEEDNKKVLDKYTLKNPEKILIAFKGLIFAFEQIGIINGEIDKKRNLISHSVRWASAYSRLSTFVNYPFNKNNIITELVNKGFYITNALNSEMSLYGHDSTKLIDFESADNSESIDFLLNQQVKNTLLIQSNLFSNIELSTTLNILQPSVLLDCQTKDHLEVFKINYNKNIPYIITTAENGNTIIWNASFGLLDSANFNFKKALKEVKDFKDVIDLKWLKKDSNYQNISDIYNIENYEITKIEKVEKLTTGTVITESLTNDKIEPNQEHTNNLYMMGFPLEACKLALIEKKNNFDQAVEYLCEKSTDQEFMSKFKKKEVKDEKISPWECDQCTLLNEKGEFSCEICGANIPEKILKEYLLNQQIKREENERLDKQSILEQISKKENVILENFQSKYAFLKDTKILNIHILFNYSDPVAPFLAVGILQDLVTNKIYVNTVKLMINPIILKDFIKISKDGFYSNITYKKFNRFEECASHLILKHSINILSLYPTFIGKSNNDQLNVLIPIEQEISEIPAISYFDSLAFDSEGQSQVVILTEEYQSVYSVFNVNIKSKYKFVNISNKSLEIILEKKQIEFLNDFPSELNIFKDRECYYIVGRNEAFSLNPDFTVKNQVPIALNLGNFKKIEPNFNEKDEIISFCLVDDNNKFTEILIPGNTKEIEKNNEVKNFDEMQDEIENKLAILEVEEMTNIELGSLSELLNFDKINIKLNPDSHYPQRSIINSESNNPLISKKVYVDLTRHSKNEKIELEIDFKSNNIIILMNLEILLISNSTNTFNKKVIDTANQTKNLKYANMLTSLNEEVTSLQNCLPNSIPLKVIYFTGAQSQKGVNIASIIYGAGVFASNYPRPDYVFAHAHDKSIFVESVVVGSVLNSKAGEAPLGEGLIYLLDSLDYIPMIRNTTYNWKSLDYERFLAEKEERDEELYEFDPVGYVLMGKSEIIRTKIIKPRMCKYIYFKPTNTRTQPKDLSSQFNTHGIIMTVFSAEGTISSNDLSLDKNLSMSIMTERRLREANLSPNTNFEIKVYGLCGEEYKELDTSHMINLNKSFTFSYINYDNNFINLFGSKLSVVNTLLQNNDIKRVKIEITGEEPSFLIQGLTVDFQSFKTVKSKNQEEFKNLKDFNITALRRVIIEKGRFNVLNKKICSYLTTKTDNIDRKIHCLKYLKYLSDKIPNLKDNIIENVDLKSYFQNNILESGDSELINLSIDFLAFIKTENNKKSIDEVCLNLLESIKDLKISSYGFKSFYKFLFSLNIDYNFLVNSLIRNIKHCLKVIRDSGFQTDSYIYLKNFLKTNSSPFDTHLYFLGKTETKLEQVQDITLVESFNLIPSYVLSEIIGDTMRLTIDLEKIYSVNSLKLEFGQCLSQDDYNFRVSIWGSNPSVCLEENFDIIQSKFYLDHTWKQLTKHHKENVILKGKEIRSILYKNLNFIGRYLHVEISINQGQFNCAEFPKFLIIPQIYGEINKEVPLYEYKKITEHFNSIIALSTQQIPVNENNYTIKKYNDPKIYLVNPDVPVTNQVSTENTFKTDKYDIDVNTIKSNLKTFQNSLEKIISELIMRKESSDEVIKGKISTILEDIKNNQIKINSLDSQFSINESLSTSNEILLSFINSVKLISIKNPESLKLSINEILNDDKDVLKFVCDLFEISVLNESGDLATEALSFIKNFLWDHLDKNSTSEFFNLIVENYLTKDNSIRSPLYIIEAIAFVDIEIDLILFKLQEAFKKNWDETQIPDAFFNISSLIMLLLIKIKNKSKQISEKCKDIIQINIEFLKYLTHESKFSKEINDIILSHALNVNYLIKFSYFMRVSKLLHLKF